MGDLSKHFSSFEFECKCGCGFDSPQALLVGMLESARAYASTRAGREIPFSFSSACRCQKHNTAEGGKDTSAHLTGEAVDIKIINSKDRYYILYGLMQAGFVRLGVGAKFIHADVSKAPFHPQDRVWTY